MVLKVEANSWGDGQGLGLDRECGGRSRTRGNEVASVTGQPGCREGHKEQ